MNRHRRLHQCWRTPCKPSLAIRILHPQFKMDVQKNLGALHLYSVILCPISIATCSGYVHSRWFQTRPNCIHNWYIELKHPGNCVMCWEAADLQNHQVCGTPETTDESFIVVNTRNVQGRQLVSHFCPAAVKDFVFGVIYMVPSLCILLLEICVKEWSWMSSLSSSLRNQTPV